MDLSNLERQRKLMSALPVDEVWGIGRRISKKLDAMGIKTVLDLADSDIRFIRKHFNVVLERTVRELRGEPCLQLEEFAPTKQEIICSRSFGERITDYPSMRQAIVVTLPGRRKNFAASINIVGLSPRLLRRHHLRSMNLITAIAHR